MLREAEENDALSKQMPYCKGIVMKANHKKTIEKIKGSRDWLKKKPNLIPVYFKILFGFYKEVHLPA